MTTLRARAVGAAALASALAGCSGLGLGGAPGETAPRVPVAAVQQQPLAPVGTASPPVQPAPAVPARTPGQGALGAPAGAPAGRAFMPMTPTNLAGEWTARDRGGSSQCRVTLGPPAAGGPAPATPSGCVSAELFRVAAWSSAGEELTLADERGQPLILLRRQGPNRYEGAGVSREAHALTR